jgi:hypothetical protein
VLRDLTFDYAGTPLRATLATGLPFSWHTSLLLFCPQCFYQVSVRSGPGHATVLEHGDRTVSVGGAVVCRCGWRVTVDHSTVADAGPSPQAPERHVRPRRGV